LTLLDLSNNIIPNLPRGLLEGLGHLQELRLAGNFITDDGLSEPLYDVLVRGAAACAA
jgi:hypothetical protein